PARAEPIEGAAVAVPGVADASVRSMQSSWMVLPRGDEVGFNLRFFTAPEGPGAGRLRFSDLVVGRLHVRHAIGGNLELYAGADFLPKQPADLGESVWQGSHLGARVGLGPTLAGYAQLGTGPLLGGGGKWGALATGLAARKRIHPAVTLQGGADAVVTGLSFAGGDGRDWLAEAGGHLDVIFFTPIQDFIYWFGFAYMMPVGSGAAATKAVSVGMDPQPRVGFEVGAAFAAGPRWDVYLAYSVHDRGDADAMATTLPILYGGFDQRQMVFGLIRRFGADPERSEYLVR
ncbi:MAG TPA: hypothetical protein VL172_13200, partial [Kofleriaceae bacterium]|nr:hypothetical protein [Kofleriaceae bacterium]